MEQILLWLWKRIIPRVDATFLTFHHIVKESFVQFDRTVCSIKKRKKKTKNRFFCLLGRIKIAKIMNDIIWENDMFAEFTSVKYGNVSVNSISVLHCLFKTKCQIGNFTACLNKIRFEWININYIYKDKLILILYLVLNQYHDNINQ